jgi:hypothetical protein
MSSSSHPIQIRPGERAARRAAEILDEMRSEQDLGHGQRVHVYERDLGKRNHAKPTRAANINARLGVVERYVGPSQRTALQNVAREVSRGGDPRRAEEALGRAEQQAQERMQTVAMQRAVLEELASHLRGVSPVTAKDFSEGEDGTMTLNTQTSAGGRIPIVLVRSESGTYHVRLEMDGSRIDTLVTPQGTLAGCAAQEAYVREGLESVRANGSDVVPEDTSAVASRPGEPRRHKAEQRQ